MEMTFSALENAVLALANRQLDREQQVAMISEVILDFVDDHNSEIVHAQNWEPMLQFLETRFPGKFNRVNLCIDPWVDDYVDSDASDQWESEQEMSDEERPSEAVHNGKGMKMFMSMADRRSFARTEAA